MELEGLGERLLRYDLLPDEDVTESLRGGLLHRHRLVELLLAQQAGAQQHIAETLGLGALEFVGEHDRALLERDRDQPAALAAHGEHAGLLLQADELKDVGQPEVLERAF